MRAGGTSYICSAGESFDLIALRVYGDERYAAELLNANPTLCATPIFSGGERLTLPEIDIPDSENQAYFLPNAPWKE